MYTIMNKQTAVIDCDTLQTAIRFVQSLESGLDRNTQHSPFTIVKTENISGKSSADVRVGATDFVCQIAE